MLWFLSVSEGEFMTKNITIQRILGILLHRIRLILISGLVAGLLFFLYTSFFITPMYSTSTMIFVQNYNKAKQSDAQQDERDKSKNESNNEYAGKIFNSDISGSSNLANICVILFRNSDEITTLYNGCNVNISVETGTFYITITVTGSDPDKCCSVANSIAQSCATVFYEHFDYGQIGTIREAKVPSAPYSPDKLKNTLIGVAIGLVGACLVAILLELIDITIRPDEDLAEIYKIPVFAEIPDFESQGR